MCNLYGVTKPQVAIRDVARAMVDGSGNLPPMPAVFPDQMAPVVMTRPSDGKRELLIMRWGFPFLIRQRASWLRMSAIRIALGGDRI